MLIPEDDANPLEYTPDAAIALACGQGQRLRRFSELQSTAVTGFSAGSERAALRA